MTLTPEEQKMASLVEALFERERYLGALQAILASGPHEAHAIARIALDEGDFKPYF